MDTDQLATNLRREVLVLARRLRPALQRDGVGTAKLSVLGWLRRAGPMSPTELASREGVKLPSLTRMLAELEAEGWVKRDADAADARRSLLSLTSVGTRRLAAAARSEDAALARALAEALDAGERRALAQACALIARIGAALSPR